MYKRPIARDVTSSNSVPTENDKDLHVLYCFRWPTHGLTHNMTAVGRADELVQILIQDVVMHDGTDCTAVGPMQTITTWAQQH